MMDIFGMMFMDYLRSGEDAKYVIYRDDGYFEHLYVKGYFSEYDEFGSLIQEALEYVSGKVLDVGCGTGKHSLYLQSLGIDVVGLDISPLATQVCKKRGLKKCVAASALNLPFKKGTFDTIIMMGNNFGIAGTLPKTRRMLMNFRELLSANGIVISHSIDPTLTNNPEHLAYHERNRKCGLPIGQVKIKLEYKKATSSWFYLLLVTPEEMKKLAEETGWRLDKFLVGQDASYIGIFRRT
ncbi:methyltransferase domain-containing protein [Candidatus Poribacteria bacterium]|nr:methyltransferase domain-containing protein [Candidatus Poribacteria bacterium]